MTEEEAIDKAEDDAWHTHKYEGEDSWEVNPSTMFRAGWRASKEYHDKKLAEIEKHLQRLEEVMQHIGGCSNHDCVLVEKKGMGTNASCKCLDDKFTAKRYGYGMSAFVKSVRKTLEK